MEPSDCPERKEIVGGGHACKMIADIAQVPLRSCEIGEDACRFCCSQKERPTVEQPNVVITSFLLNLSRRMGDANLEADVGKLHDQAQSGIFEKAGNYFEARTKWAEAGKPMRSEEEIKEVFEICQGCDHFTPHADGGGKCGLCGCWLYPRVTRVNKIQWATETCPLKPPKWGGSEKDQLRISVSGVKPLNQREILRLNGEWTVEESMRDGGRGLIFFESRIDPPVVGIVVLHAVIRTDSEGVSLIQVGFKGSFDVKFRNQERVSDTEYVLKVLDEDSVRDLDLTRASATVEVL